ncbi:TPA: hypothetical protein N0F65_004578 [Lagenidium giganteum]|uniref:Uncharacterized protein n=1 Tax=Lagenidium giganteum TaxID=4803 RepID=A0AAV2ZFQ6_9STRA|nr:TPA: hypothetical protein N0F65_004578 [Lagenidium giganteum]
MAPPAAEWRRIRCKLQGLAGDEDYARALTLLRGFCEVYSNEYKLDAEPYVDAATYARFRLPRASPDVPATAPMARIFLDAQAEPCVFTGYDQLVAGLKRLMNERYAPQAISQPLVASNGPVKLFVSGDRTQVGKSTVCLGIIGSLLAQGLQPDQIAYIKPATQCEAPQLIARFCHQHGIACRDIGPILFYSGFTREFLQGNTASSKELLAQAREAVETIGRGKQVVVVDGVGYPAVGSICGVSNARVAHAIGAPVVLVGKKGVGDAVDSFNLNASFFESHDVTVLGGIFNRFPTDGFYSLDKCEPSIRSYFAQFQPDKRVYGLLPEIPMPANGTGSTGSEADQAVSKQDEAKPRPMTAAEAARAEHVIALFKKHVDVKQLLKDAIQNQHTGSSVPVPSRKRASPATAGLEEVEPSAKVVRKSREEIQAAAKASGASGG